MKKADGSSIVNISSMNSIVAGAVGYADTKFAVRGMTKATAIYLASLGIRVNSVHPGLIATPMAVKEDTKSAVEAFSQRIPLKRVAQPEEVLKICYCSWFLMRLALSMRFNCTVIKVHEKIIIGFIKADFLLV